MKMKTQHIKSSEMKLKQYLQRSIWHEMPIFKTNKVSKPMTSTYTLRSQGEKENKWNQSKQKKRNTKNKSEINEIKTKKLMKSKAGS